MNGLEEVFLPSARHRHEEQLRLEWTRDDEGEGDPCRGPIDLESGIVHIRIGPQATDSAQ
ncbi:DUF6191 domain-containing protein [Streptomyces sp. NK08204]|uniref:DUF6191 domain-containing protein n=1 Tax=Streptomyces sp. NK08204 TaxID=2873260 RepID=UPI001CEC03B6|nr:DUF6191 domain-containing protein [Streptomyces sp. NK08204]